MTNVDINFFRGNSYSRSFNIYGWNRNIDEIYFSVKENENDKNCVLQKYLNHGLTLMANSDTVKTYNLNIDAIDTDNMKVDYDYIFDIKIISGNIKKTIVKGNLTLESEITKTQNERGD